MHPLQTAYAKNKPLRAGSRRPRPEKRLPPPFQRGRGGGGEAAAPDLIYHTLNIQKIT